MGFATSVIGDSKDRVKGISIFGFNYGVHAGCYASVMPRGRIPPPPASRQRDDAPTMTGRSVVETLRQFGMVPLRELRLRPDDEQRDAALANLDALTAVALSRARQWQREGDTVSVGDPDTRGALAAQQAAHEILGIGAEESADDPDRPPRAWSDLVTLARESLRKPPGDKTRAYAKPQLD